MIQKHTNLRDVLKDPQAAPLAAAVWTYRKLRRFTIRAGWPGLVLIATIFATIGFAFWKYAVPWLVTASPRWLSHSDLTGWLVFFFTMYVLFGVWICFAFMLALIRRGVNQDQPEWDAMTTRARLMRALLTIAGVALFTAPFAWVVWLLLRE